MDKEQKRTLKYTGAVVLILFAIILTIFVVVKPFGVEPDETILTLQPIDPFYDPDGSVFLEWNEVYGDYYYYIDMSRDGGSWEHIKTTTDLSFIKIGLIDGTYKFRVSAFNIMYFLVALSNEESVIVELEYKPEAPFMNALDYEIVEDEVRIYLDWEEVDCYSYNVYRSENYSDCYEIIAEDVLSTGYSEVLTKVGVYEYYVTAVSIYGESEPSQTVIVIITKEGVPSEPIDYTMIYVLLGVLAILIVPVAILVKRKSKKS